MLPLGSTGVHSSSRIRYIAEARDIGSGNAVYRRYSSARRPVAQQAAVSRRDFARVLLIDGLPSLRLPR
jgi:hypothetical protein